MGPKLDSAGGGGGGGGKRGERGGTDAPNRLLMKGAGLSLYPFLFVCRIYPV